MANHDGLPFENIFPIIPEFKNPLNKSFADNAVHEVVRQIQQFEKALPPDMQAGGSLVNFGNTVFAIDRIGYKNPNLIIFYGLLPDGSNVRLIQHISQLNLLLTAVKRLNPETPRRQIGFSPEQD